MTTTVTLPCSQCGAQLRPTGRANSARCEYCGTDNLIDPAIASQIAAQGPIAPPEQQQRVEAVLASAHSDPAKMMETLAERLSAALPDAVETQKGGLFSSHLTKIAAQIGDWRYEIERQGQKLKYARLHSVRGIALKRSELSFAEFTRTLTAELYELSREKQPHALDRFLTPR